MGLRVIAIGEKRSYVPELIILSSDLTDTGAPKRELCMKLGAEKWVDFLESKDLIRDVQAAADGLGPHSALTTVGQEKVLTQAIMYLRASGTLITVGMPGATNGNLNVPVSAIIVKVRISCPNCQSILSQKKCLTIVGSSTGSV